MKAYEYKTQHNEYFLFDKNKLFQINFLSFQLVLELLVFLSLNLISSVSVSSIYMYQLGIFFQCWCQGHLQFRS